MRALPSPLPRLVFLDNTSWGIPVPEITWDNRYIQWELLPLQSYITIVLYLPCTLHEGQLKLYCRSLWTLHRWQFKTKRHRTSQENGTQRKMTGLRLHIAQAQRCLELGSLLASCRWRFQTFVKLSCPLSQYDDRHKPVCRAGIILAQD